MSFLLVVGVERLPSFNTRLSFARDLGESFAAPITGVFPPHALHRIHRPTQILERSGGDHDLLTRQHASGARRFNPPRRGKASRIAIPCGR